VGYHFGRVDVDVTGKLAMGVSQQRVNISGLTTDVTGGWPCWVVYEHYLAISVHILPTTSPLPPR
jgi:hypothetical protein